jgi:hypothetical protein
MSQWHVQRLRTSVDTAVDAVPAWAERVPRWQQIDAASYALAEAWHRWTEAGAPAALLAPDVFVLANRRASNEADAAFVRTGAFSPARFVATLPSVPLAAMLQTTGWEGPMLCVQAGPRTLVAALGEAAAIVRADAGATVGVVTCALRERVVDVAYWGVGAGVAGEMRLRARSNPTGPGSPPAAGTGAVADGASCDDELHAWLESGRPGALSLSPLWELVR